MSMFSMRESFMLGIRMAGYLFRCATASKTLIGILLIFIIGLLETLLQLSWNKQGLCKVREDHYVRYGLAIIAALVVGLVPS
ncbi:hypothetical protein F5B20DRAFT_534052 [Whalleya microplaca]|nr:hypothetical protein F5B20DRAFT_534052 [Whalleya microplaca]